MKSEYDKYSLVFFDRRIIFILLLFFQTATSIATEQRIGDDVKGIWYQPDELEHASFEWKASWIWVDEQLETEAIFVRYQFQVESLPNKALLRITASSQYQLFVNGEYICRGPARSAPHHQSYDILDITKLLQTGENLIAVRVHHQDGKYSYQYRGRAGLLAQLNIENIADETIINSDATWNILPDPSWDDDAPLISRFQQVVNDRVDFRNYPKGWETLEFDDSEWSNATELMRKTGWPSPQKNAKAQPLTPPWTSLVARDIPYLVEKDIKADKLIESSLTSINIDEAPIIITGEDNLSRSADNVLELPAINDSRSWFLLYDFGEVINGMPKLNIQGAPGTEIIVVTAPFIVDDKFSKVTVDSEFADKIILSGKKDQWEATYFKPTRYLVLIVRNEAKLKLHSVGIHKIEYPFEKRGSIESRDAPWVKKYFDASAKTIEVCTTDGYTDNYRERRQYAQTGFYASLGNYYAFGDRALQRRYLVQTAQEQQANGIMPAYAPAASDDFMIILDSNCLWIRSLHNYLLYSGDFKTVRELLPAARKLMNLLHNFTNTLGMIDNPPYAYWLDHALNDRRGANFNLNGHYLGALKDFAQVLQWLDEPDVELFKDRADLLRVSLRSNLWDERQGLFADALIDEERSTMFSEHANTMALALQIATSKQAERIAREILVEDDHNYIKRASGVTMVTPAMSYFLHKGLCEYGYIDASFRLFQARFDKMFSPETNGTLWEEWWLDAIGRTGKLQKGRTRSDAQTESSFPPALFAEFLLGVQPVKPGMKEMLIIRQNSSIKNIKGSIPTPAGPLKIEWNLESKNRSMTTKIPGGVKVKLDIASLGAENINSIKVNGKCISMEKAKEQYLLLEAGTQQVQF